MSKVNHNPQPAANAVQAQTQQTEIGEVRLDGRILTQVASQATHGNRAASRSSDHETQK